MSEIMAGAPGSVAADAGQSAESAEPQTNELGTQEEGTESESLGSEKVVKSKPAPNTADDSFEVVVDGEKRRLTRDQAIREIQKSQAASKRFQQAAQKEKQLEAFVNDLKSDPEATLEKLLGDRLDSIAEARLSRKVQQASLSPEQIQQLEMQRELEQYRAEKKQAEEARSKNEALAAQKQAIDHYDTLIGGLLTKANLPAVPAVIQTAATVLLDILELQEQGINPTDEQIVAEIKERMSENSSSFMKRVGADLQGDALLDYFGEEFGERYVEALMKRHGARNPYKSATTKQPEQTKQNSEKPMTEAEYLAWLKTQK